MKFIFSFLLYIAPVCIVYSQDCNTQAANKPFTFTRSQDNFQYGGGSTTKKPASLDITKMKSNLSKAEAWIKNILTGFTGAKLDYHNNYFFDPVDFLDNKSNDHSPSYAGSFYKATSIKGYYYCNLMFFEYYCYDNKLPMHTEDESGSSVKVIFNNVLASDLSTNVGVFTINGKYAFTILEKSRSEGRIDYYEQLAKSNVEDKFPSKNDFIIIRNSDQPVFIPITRKEYLPQLLKNIDANSGSQLAFAKSMYNPKNESANKAALEEELKRIDHSKNYTPEQMAPYRKRVIETWETEQQKLDKQIARIETEIKGAKEVLMEYMQKPAEWQGRNIQNFYPFDNYSATALKDYFEKLDHFRASAEEESRAQIVSINPAYYNKSLSADIPQLIMLYLRKGTYPHMRKVASLVKQPGALAPLEAIMNPGKSTSPETVPPVLISSYTLQYLPKLTKLTPLIVPTDMKPSAAPFVNNYNSNEPATKFNFVMPTLSAKLNQLPQP